MYDAHPAPETAAVSALPEWHSPGHPILMGVAAVALAVAAWHGLLWRVEHPVEETASAQLAAPVAETGFADSALVNAPADTSRPVAPSAAPAPAQAATRPSDTTPAATAIPAPTRSTTSDSSDGLSPFRRSHPWAAVPGQPYYYPSRCPATLRFSDLVFFRTQAQARAEGFVPAPDSGCG